MYAGTADTQAAADLGLPMALLKQLGGLHPASLEGRKVPPWPHGGVHASQPTTEAV
jgi:hypothetical protein